MRRLPQGSTGTHPWVPIQISAGISRARWAPTGNSGSCAAPAPLFLLLLVGGDDPARLGSRLSSCVIPNSADRGRPARVAAHWHGQVVGHLITCLARAVEGLGAPPEPSTDRPVAGSNPQKLAQEPPHLPGAFIEEFFKENLAFGQSAPSGCGLQITRCRGLLSANLDGEFAP